MKELSVEDIDPGALEAFELLMAALGKPEAVAGVAPVIDTKTGEEVSALLVQYAPAPGEEPMLLMLGILIPAGQVSRYVSKYAEGGETGDSE